MMAIGTAIGTGLFLGSGLAIGIAGPSVLITYVVGAVIALLIMGCLAEMTVAHPIPGSFGAYAGHYLGPLAGFLVRYCYWSGVVLAVAAAFGLRHLLYGISPFDAVTLGTSILVVVAVTVAASIVPAAAAARIEARAALED